MSLSCLITCSIILLLCEHVCFIKCIKPYIVFIFDAGKQCKNENRRSYRTWCAVPNTVNIAKYHTSPSTTGSFHEETLASLVSLVSRPLICEYILLPSTQRVSQIAIALQLAVRAAYIQLQVNTYCNEYYCSNI